MSNKVCYIVEGSAGEHEEYRWWINGMFDNPLDAEKLKIEINKEIDLVRNTPEPFDINTELLTNEQFELWDLWSEKQNTVGEHHYATVVEYPFGKRIGK